MNPRAAIVAAGLAIVLAIAAYVLIRTVQSPDEARRAEVELFQFEIKSVHRVLVRRGGVVLYDLERENFEWRYRIPATLGKADAGKVLRAISDLRFEAMMREDVSAEGAVSPERYGFAPAKLEVNVYVPGRTYTYEVGNANPMGDGVYLRILPGGRVVVTRPVVATLFATSPDAFLPFDGSAEGPLPGGR